MQYYVVTEGRANALDRLKLRDRSTYGLDWMVFDASSAGDGIRQWNLYKAGTHPRQAELEAEAAQYRAATSGYAPAWEAEREAIAVEAAERLRAVEAEQRLLREKQADLEWCDGACGGSRRRHRRRPARGAGRSRHHRKKRRGVRKRRRSHSEVRRRRG